MDSKMLMDIPQSNVLLPVYESLFYAGLIEDNSFQIYISKDPSGEGSLRVGGGTDKSLTKGDFNYHNVSMKSY